MTSGAPLDEIKLEAVKHQATTQEFYRFFDTLVEIKTNRKDILDGFNKIYWRFKQSPSGDVIRKQELYLLDTSSNKPEITIICDDEVQVIENQTITPNFYLFIFSYIIPRVKSHFLVHAATMSYEDKVTVITAHSTSGKTTLSVELIKRNISFLSDELAPINRVSHLIDPFPRSIGLRNLVLHHLDTLDASKIYQAPNSKGEIKWMIDPEALSPGSVGKSCPCKNVIFLEPQYDEEPGSGKQILEITLTRLTPSLLYAIRGLQGVQSHEVVDDRMFPLVRLTVEKDSKILQDVEEATKVYQSAIVSVVYGKTRKPDFSLTPSLKPMSKFEGTFELSKMLLNAHSETALMDEFKQSPAFLLTQMADITQNFNFYKLMVGKLDKMTSLAEELIKS
jgi:hypothetical protein